MLRSPGSWSSGRPCSSCDRARRVVLEEVDRLADVGVGLRPRLARLAHGERRQFEAALAHQSRPPAAARPRARRRRGPTSRGRPRRRRARPLRRLRAPTPRARSRRPRSGSPGRSRSSSAGAPLPRSVDRHRSGSLARRARASAARSACARTDSRRNSSSGSLWNVRVGGHGFSSSTSRSAPLVCAARNESLEVFSSRRRTR